QLKQHKEFMQKPHPIACRLFDIRSRGLVRPLTEKEKKTIEKLQEKLKEPPWSPEEKRVFEGILHGDLVFMAKTRREDFIDFDKRLMGAEWVSEMRKQRNLTNEEMERREELIKSVHAKLELWKRVELGDDDALWECMYDTGICSKEDLDEYYKNKNNDGEREGYG
ncbi:MAG: hypothetical protein Q8L98_04315, partial [Chlamydiales bacterium]|nr:hypothetical protein [Chlamydiales bacterium]